MGSNEASGAQQPPSRIVLVIAFHIEGDLRFISHHDTLRLFRRALARAGLPVRFSEGFNPHPRMTMPLPRPVGVASGAELLVVEMAEPIDADEAARRLEPQLPQGLRIERARQAAPGESFHAQEVRYRLEAEGQTAAELESAIRHTLESDAVEMERINPGKGTARRVDIRPYIEDITVLPDGAVEFTLKVTGAGTARPSEIAALLGYNPDSINHRIRRVEVRWQ